MSKSYYKLEVDSNLWRSFKTKCATQGKNGNIMIDFTTTTKGATKWKSN